MTVNANDTAGEAKPSNGRSTAAGDNLGFRLVGILVGTLLVATSTALLTSYSALIDPPPSWLCLCSMVGAVGVAVTCIPQFWKDLSLTGGWKPLVGFLLLSFVAAGAGAALVLLSCLPAFHREYALNKAWNFERTRFAQSGEGFPVLQRVAREQFGLELVLGTAEDSYQATTHRPAGSSGSSSGLMTVLPGYCQLGIWPVGVAMEFPVADSGTSFPDQRTVLGVAFHELGHCVDMSRDQASFKDPHVGTASIGPGDRVGVKDIQTYVVAERKSQTKLWREIYADLFAVGYVGLEWKGDAPVFERALLNERIAHASDDPTHATACWVQAALKAAPPDSLATLSQWADARRASAPCKLPASVASANL